ncbi:MAG: hypothetical protein LUF32_08315 [Clostridiales bacterium]|nr:hypothetical protein [Clostridiales bacterium]
MHTEQKSVSEGISRRQEEMDRESIREIDRVMRKREREAGNRRDGAADERLGSEQVKKL